MKWVIFIAIFVACWMFFIRILLISLKRGASSNQFNFIIIGGISIVILILFYVGVLLSNFNQITLDIMLLGLFIAILNFAVGYPIVYLANKDGKLYKIYKNMLSLNDGNE